MKSVSNFLLFCLLSLWIIACNKLSEREQKALNALEQKFPNYEFSELEDISEAYLKVRSRKDNLDSLELKEIYEELIQLRRDTLKSGQPNVNWIYLVVYDKDNEYLFTIVKNNDKILFFKDGVN